MCVSENGWTDSNPRGAQDNHVGLMHGRITMSGYFGSQGSQLASARVVLACVTFITQCVCRPFLGILLYSQD